MRKFSSSLCFSKIAYWVSFDKCLNIKVDDETRFVHCLRKSCPAAMGFLSDDQPGEVILHNVREVLFRPYGSYIRGRDIHNLSTFRMMYNEMVEIGDNVAPQIALDIPRHTIEPFNTFSVHGNNIHQVALNEESVDAEGISRQQIRVRDFSSIDLFGKNNNFLGRLVLNEGLDSASAESSTGNLLQPGKISSALFVIIR